jgi:hypothetical protein
MKNYIAYLLIVAQLAVFACGREIEIGAKPKGGEKEVMLKVAIPYTAPKEASTRAMGATQENAIETLDILSFKVEGGVETFQYWAQAKRGGNNDEGGSFQQFNAKLLVKEYSQCFVLITNARSKVQALMANHPDGWVGQLKETMLQNLIFDLGGSDRWKAISASNYTSIPMWGETAPKIINANSTSISTDPIPLLRMIAKIDVQLDESVQGITNAFKLKSVRLYNINTLGRIVPKPGTQYVGTDMKAVKASLPSMVTSVSGPMLYTDFSSPGTVDIAMKGAIYLFETAAYNGGNPLLETCIVVGGLFGADNVESYYRLDFLATNGTTYVDILRNHKYTFNITAVKGCGYSSVNEALNSQSFNMTANMVAWDEGEIRYIYFDDHYMLGVSHDRFDFSDKIYTTTDTDNIIKITTDYPTGWTASVWGDLAGTVPASWLNISPALGAGGAQPDEMRLTMSANLGAQPRTAYIHIQAGRLNGVVTVEQAASPPPPPPQGGSADILYFDANNVLRVGKWNSEITTANLENIAFFKFGGVVGFKNGNAYTPAEVVFNTTKSALSQYYGMGSSDASSTLPYVPGYTTVDWDNGIINTSDLAYHNHNNITTKGKGDPCKLVGLTGAQIAATAGDPVAYYVLLASRPAADQEWRTATAEENARFIGGPNAGWKAGETYTDYKNNFIGSSSGAYNYHYYIPGSSSPANPWAGVWLPVIDGPNPNSSGAFVLTPGWRSTIGEVVNVGVAGYFWSSTPRTRGTGTGGGTAYLLHASEMTLSADPNTPREFGYGFSVRCVRNLPQLGTIALTPDNLMLPYTAQNPASQSVSVTALQGDGSPDLSAQWSLTSNQSWLTLSLNSDGSASSATVSGTGSKTVYLVAGVNSSINNRTAALYLDGVTTNIKVNVVQNYNINLPGGFGDILYFDASNVLRVGRWGKEISTTNRNNIAFFKFGGAVGFKNGATFSAAEVVFNTTNTAVTSYGSGSTDAQNSLAYNRVPAFWTTDWSTGVRNISDPAYHNHTNVTVNGRGDPCKLAGYTGAQIAAMNPTQFIAINSGWRLATAEENAKFAGGPNSGWQLGNAAYTHAHGTTSTTYNFWVSSTNSPANPWGGGWFPIAGPSSTTPNTAGSFIGSTGIRSTNGQVTNHANNNSDISAWSGTPVSTTMGHYLSVVGSTIAPVATREFAYGKIVRCVRDN